MKAFGTFALNALTGAALGAFLALLIALSHSPVVAPTLSVLAAAAVVYLSLNGSLPIDRSTSLSADIQARALGFCVAGIVALLIGLHVRANNMLGESQLQSEYRDLVAIGVTEGDARKLVTTVYSARMAKRTEVENLASTSTLFGSSSAAACDEMTPSRYQDDQSLRTKYVTEGGDWKSAIDSFDAKKTQAAADLRSYLQAVHTVICN